MKSFTTSVAVVIAAILLAQMMAYNALFAGVMPSDERQQPEAIVVFAGEAGRIKEGFQRADKNQKLIVSPANEIQFAKYQHRYHSNEPVVPIIESKARTTFENALYCSKIIKENNFRDICLVTSAYHMPRSYILTRLMLIGSKVKIHRIPIKSPRINSKTKRIKMQYNEMVKLWGSLGEMLYYLIRGHVPEASPKSYTAIRMLRSVFLFRV